MTSVFDLRATELAIDHNLQCGLAISERYATMAPA